MVIRAMKIRERWESKVVGRPRTFYIYGRAKQRGLSASVQQSFVDMSDRW